MSTNPTNSAEIFKAPEVKQAPKEKQSTELVQALSETASEAMAPSVDIADSGLEMGDGIEDSEKLREGGENASENKAFTFKKGGSKKSGKTSAQIKSQLLQNVPTEAKMRAQVEREIKSEIRWLRRRAFFIGIGLTQASPFELNNIVKKIRDLREMLRNLAGYTAEMLKAMWLRFVHGII